MIFGNTQLGKSLDISWRELSALSYRAEVTANNIANADTPNFKRSTVNFETQLKEALMSEAYKPPLEAAKTNPMHTNFFDPIDYRSVAPKRTLDWQTQGDNNGNNVDIDAEAVEMRKITMQYQVVMKSMFDNFQRISIVLS